MRKPTLRETISIIEGFGILEGCLGWDTQQSIYWICFGKDEKSRKLLKEALDERNKFIEKKPFDKAKMLGLNPKKTKNGFYTETVLSED